MRLPRTPLALSVLLVAALHAPAGAQMIALDEGFDGGTFPPPGWTEQGSGVSAGWEPGLANAFHNDWAGAQDDSLLTPAMDLSGWSRAFLHFHNRVRYANFMAHHPNSQGDGVSTVEASTDGGASWAVVWSEGRVVDGEETTTVDLGAYAGAASLTLRFRYQGDFAHEWTVDEVRVDDSPFPPPPPGTLWDVELPSTFVAAPLSEDFDVHAGTVPSYMALTERNAATGLPDADAWANVGNRAPMTFTSHSGAYNLEMGLRPGSSNTHDVRNAMVLGIDGAGIRDLALSFWAVDFGDEMDAFDGIWVSQNGDDWFQVGDWAGAGSGSWASITGMDLTNSPVRTSGRFYLMFAQEDNFPYANLDGYGVDDVVVDGTPPAQPSLGTVGACPGAVDLVVSGATPGGGVAFAGALAPGFFTVPSGNCAGTLLDLQGPVLLGLTAADGAGSATVTVQVPASHCGVAVVQALDLATCGTSNTAAP